MPRNSLHGACCSPDPWADPKSRSTLGVYSLQPGSSRVQIFFLFFGGGGCCASFSLVVSARVVSAGRGMLAACGSLWHAAGFLNIKRFKLVRIETAVPLWSCFPSSVWDHVARKISGPSTAVSRFYKQNSSRPSLHKMLILFIKLAFAKGLM